MPDFEINSPLELEESLTTLGLVKGGLQLNAPPLDVTQGVDTASVVSLRRPQYGIPLADRLAFLAEQLPTGQVREVGLFSSMPDRAGVGGTEASGSGYARVSHSSWRNDVVGGYIARRLNNGEVRFAALTGDLTVVGWGAWDTGGALRAFGLLRGVDSNPRVYQLAASDEPGWTDGTLVVGIQ